MITNLALTLFVSTNVTLHWEPSPDTSVVSYTLYSSTVSRYTNEYIPAASTPPQIGDTPSPTIVRAKYITVGTNGGWKTTAAPISVGNVTNVTLVSPLDSTRLFWSVTATDSTSNESDLSNEVLLNPRWLWVTFAIEASHDLTNWAVIGRTNLWRVWRPEGASFFRGRMIIAP